MKKIYSILFAATALFAASSCQKEIAGPETEAPQAGAMTVTATIDAEGKTTLDGLSTYWAEGDKISVFDSNKGANNRCFTIAATEFPAKKATFTYDGEFVMPQNGQEDPTVVALYPYQAEAYCDFFYYDRNYITGIEVPAAQTAVAGSFDPAATFALAIGTQSTKDNLTFNNLYSLLKFTVKDSGVKKVTVTTGENEFIAGTAKVQLALDATKKPVFTGGVLTASGTNTVTLNCAAGFVAGTTYYIAVAPAAYTSIKIALDGEVVKESAAAKTLAANTVYSLGELAKPLKLQNWGVTGTMTNWADKADLPMTYEDGWYVAKNVTITIDDLFKFRTDGVWGNERTCEGPVAAGVEKSVAAGSGDITVAASAIYDVCLSYNADKMKLVKVGDIEVPEEPVASDWGIVGDLTNWADKQDITMYSYQGMYVAYNVTFKAAGGFKIRKGGTWNDAYNYGLESSGNVTAGHYYNVITSGGSGDLKVPAGTYDIWFDLTGKKIYVLTPGGDPSEATLGTVIAPLTSTWYLVGSFNGWNTKQEQYKMTAEGNWYVLKGLTLSANAEVKVCDGSWSVNRGGTFAGVGKACSVSQNGSNIKVTKAGTYDVYLNAAATKLYFMEPGQTPAN
jgi:hypothetical protein